MNAMEFVNTVREMRTAQKDYFKNRLRTDLIRSKELERAVDKALAEGVTVFETKSLAGEVEQMALGFGEFDAGDIFEEKA